MSKQRESVEWLYKLKDMMTPDLAKITARMDALEQKISTIEQKTGNTFKKMTGHTAKFGKAISQIVDGLSSKFPALGNAVGLLTNPYVLLGAAVASVGVLIAKSIGVASEYNHQFLELQNLNLDKTQAQIKELNDSVLNISLEKGLDPTKTSKAFFDIQSATGKYGKEVEDIVGKIGDFSKATKADMDTMTGAVAKAMSTYRFGADQLDRFFESNAKTVQTGITTFDELAKVQTEFAGSAVGAGQGFDTANKFFAGFTKISKSVDIAANLTKTAFQGLADPKVQEGLKAYGINVFDANGKMREATTIVSDLNSKIKTMNDMEFSNFMGSVGGPEGMRALLQTIKGQGDDLLLTFNAFDNSKFSVADALKNAKGDVTTLKQILSGQVKTLMVQLGQVFIPVIAKGLNQVIEFMKGIKLNFSGVNDEGSKMNNLMQSAMQVVRVIWQLFTLQYRIMIPIQKKLIEFYQRSELIQDVAKGIGVVFKGIGDVIDWLIDKIEWLMDNTLGPMLDRIDHIYSMISGKAPKTNNSQMDYATEYIKSQGLDPAQFYQQNKGEQSNLLKLMQQGKREEALNRINQLVSASKNANKPSDTKQPAAGFDYNGGVVSGKDINAVTSGGKSVKNITVNINQLVGNITNTVTNVKEGMTNSEEIVKEALIKVVRDSEMTLGD